jgi:hypothetical protein
VTGAALLLAALLLLGGLAPFLLGPLLAAVRAGAAPNALAGAVDALRSGTQTGPALLALLGLLAPALAFLAWPAHRAPDPLGLARRSLARRALRLTALADALGSGLLALGAALQRVSGLIEGRRVRVWTLAAAAIVAVLPLRPALEPPGPIPGGWLATLPFLVAGAIALAMLLDPRPLTTLIALGAAYLLSAASLAATGGEGLVVALLQLVAGTMVVAMLALAAASGPTERPSRRSARRLGTLVPGAAGGRDLGLLALALLSALAIVAGIRALSFPLEVPEAVLRPALALAFGGVLVVVAAGQSLRLIAGVLLALVGFQLAYAHLDPGVLIAAGLAVFQLLFTVVAGYFVGLDPAVEDG